MRIGYIYLFGEEYEEWKKYNKPVSVLIEECKELGCDKIYMDVFIEEYGFPEIERSDIQQLFDVIRSSTNDDEMIIRGTVPHLKNEVDLALKREIKRIKKRHHRQI